VANLCAKFQVSYINRSRDMEVVPNFLKKVPWPINDP